jgi:hypothetical protein
MKSLITTQSLATPSSSLNREADDRRATDVSDIRTRRPAAPTRGAPSHSLDYGSHADRSAVDYQARLVPCSTHLWIHPSGMPAGTRKRDGCPLRYRGILMHRGRLVRGRIASSSHHQLRHVPAAAVHSPSPRLASSSFEISELLEAPIASASFEAMAGSRPSST